jgi:hypothetical protein
MVLSPEQIYRDYMEFSKEIDRKYNTPAKARAFLIKAGHS